MSDTIRSFNRFELKYLLTLKQVDDLKKDLKKYVVPDKYWDGWAYNLSSLYYDTDDFQFYWEKIEGFRFRRKLRIRRYVTNEPLTDDSIVYVEIKQRIDRVTQKRRVPMTYKEALALVHEEKIPEKFNPRDKPVIDEILNFVITYWLKPSATTIYKRQAFFWTENDIGLRITFDTDIGFKLNDTDLANPQPEWLMMSPNYSILEVKANEKIPFWVTELVASHGIRLIRVSKYCQAIETAWVYPQTVFNLASHIPHSYPSPLKE